MVNRSESSAAARQALSALMDGDLEPGAAGEACAAWRHDADARASWHAYHLIGDVLRSEDLATRPASDEAFLQSLRARLADEPVPMAPSPLVHAPAAADAAGAAALQVANGAPPPRPRNLRWRMGRMMAPAAVAAGFVAVAGVMVVTRVMAPEPVAGPTLAAAPAGAMAASGMLVRDARLDRYLSAHRSLANGTAAAGGAEHRVQIVFEGQ